MLGIADEPAHLATAGLVLLNVPGLPALPFLAGSVAPDLDHIPPALSPRHPEPGDPRPRSHCLLALAPLALLSPPAAAGALVHFARDFADSSGVPLFWPLSDLEVKVPYPLYAAAVAGLAWRACASTT